MKGRILSLCDVSARMVEPWREAGWECDIVDVQHPAGESYAPCGTRKLGFDVQDPDLESFLYPEYHLVFSFPPCTDLCSSGARWWKYKGDAALIRSLRIVGACLRLSERGRGWMLENPIGRLSRYWRGPDYYFNPNEYALLSGVGEAYTKKTGIWCSSNFVMPHLFPLPPFKGSWIREMPNCKNRALIRSLTPLGFARAVFMYNWRSN